MMNFLKWLLFFVFLIVAIFFLRWAIHSHYFAIYDYKIFSLENLDTNNDDGFDYNVAVVLGNDLLENASLIEEDIKNLDLAYDLYIDKKVDKIILSGNKDHVNGNGPIAMMDYLVKRDIPIKDLNPDYYSLSNYHSCSRLIEVFNMESVILISEYKNAERALLNCNYLTLEAVAVSLDLDNNALSFSNFKEEFTSLIDLYLFSPEVKVDDAVINIYKEAF